MYGAMPPCMTATATLFDEIPEITGVRRAITLAPTSRGKIVGSSESMRNALDTVRRVAASMCTVLVTGASGTGKELLVAALHDASPRANEALVTINCGAIPENLIESELFGHARGAFTGAHARSHGTIAAAEKGTLFLDEIGELPLAMQVKLLRVLQAREYTPVGESRAIKCDVRIVAATNRDLEAEVAAGRFREDLYYRLNVIHVHLPSLCERREDIADLASHFLKHAALRAGKGVMGFTDEAITALEAYDWPGNIRALENAVERAVLLASGRLIDVADLPTRVREAFGGGSAQREEASRNADVIPLHLVPFTPGAFDPPAMPTIPDALADRHDATPPPRFALANAVHELPEAGVNLRTAVEKFENELITQALERTHWNKQRAARLLGINRTTLVEMVKRKGISPAA